MIFLDGSVEHVLAIKLPHAKRYHLGKYHDK